jgi:hypothetical protein
VRIDAGSGGSRAGGPGPARGPDDRWLVFVLGAAAGFLTGMLVARRVPLGDGPGPGAPADRRTLSDAWSDAVESLASARDYVMGPPELSEKDLRIRLDGLPGGDAVRIRALGEGIVELIGSAPDDGVAADLLAAAAAEPGVEVVVNRIWTPTSGASGED